MWPHKKKTKMGGDFTNPNQNGINQNGFDHHRHLDFRPSACKWSQMAVRAQQSQPGHRHSRSPGGVQQFPRRLVSFVLRTARFGAQEHLDPKKPGGTFGQRFTSHGSPECAELRNRSLTQQHAHQPASGARARTSDRTFDVRVHRLPSRQLRLTGRHHMLEAPRAD